MQSQGMLPGTDPVDVSLSAASVPLKTREPRALFRLATELLQLIFMEATRGDVRCLWDWDLPFHPLDDIKEKTLRLGDLTWLYITHVCRRWRAVALGCPSLWKKLRFGQPSMVQAIIDRSRPVPLVIEWDSHPESEEEDTPVEGLLLAMQHVSRASTLSICAPPELLGCCLPFMNSSTSLQHLTHLRICSQFETTPLPIPDTLPCVPTLQSLRVDDCFLPWSSPVLRSPNLTELRIEVISETGRDVEQMLAALRNLPNIELLSLNMGYDWQEEIDPQQRLLLPAPSTNFEPIQLRKARLLRFAGTLDDCAHFLDHFHVPADAYVYLHACRVRQHSRAGMGVVVDDRLICGALAHHLDRRNQDARVDFGLQTPFRCVGIRDLHFGGFRMDFTSRYADTYPSVRYGWPARSHAFVDLTRTLQDNGMSPLLSFVINDESDDLADLIGDAMELVVLRLCAALPLLDVNTLVTDDTMLYLQDDLWNTISSNMGTLETVVMEASRTSVNTLRGFFRQLSPSRMLGSDRLAMDHPSFQFIPSLKHLEIKDDDAVLSEASLFALLAAKLRQRQEQGKGLQSLKLSGSLTDEQLDELTKYVDQVQIRSH
ncbi:hypothetical protein EVG20_g11314 [Dentipellis fragilis]|uniref:Uncharacterized protein n=1 Tax=Dentipellis fragilis TaxID=205917 RepID=A0A4Y9XKR0_9AGAM|nr:hypothetical protein EVG20_g11314 [Dentipellis fragilis]